MIAIYPRKGHFPFPAIYSKYSILVIKTNTPVFGLFVPKKSRITIKTYFFTKNFFVKKYVLIVIRDFFGTKFFVKKYVLIVIRNDVLTEMTGGKVTQLCDWS